MTPVIKRLKENFFNQSSDQEVLELLRSPETIRPDIYHKMVSSHLVITIEYSLLSQQIRSQVLSEKFLKEEQIRSALLLAGLLEHIYHHYLIVPREVRRLREQQELYRSVLGLRASTDPVDDSLPFSQEVRNRTIQVNLYRLFFIRTKRFLDLIARLDTSASWYRTIIRSLDKYTDPVLPHLMWLFFLPRLLVNISLLIKHTVPGPWMTSDKEKSLKFFVRFQAQLQRRWFELANDLAWISVNIINCFVLIGLLAPVAAYLGIAFFGYDILLSIGRTYIELKRLYDLQKYYQNLRGNAENKEEIQDHLDVLKRQINFEKLRLSTHILSTTGIFLAMCCLAPFFAGNPIIPLIGASILLLICLINFALVPIINHYRPKDTIPPGIKKLGFFAPPEVRAEPDNNTLELTPV